jgi:hypothetical protein
MRMPTDRTALVRDLQHELRRVGCYEGELHGVWTPVTRSAMRTFTERVNATLPVDDPDVILLTLVRGHAGEACGQSCPAGQEMADGARCVPTAILAQAQSKRAPQPAPRQVAAAEPAMPAAANNWATVTTAAAPSPRGAARTSAISGWSTKVAAAAPAPASHAPSPAPAGRMALAGPPQADPAANNDADARSSPPGAGQRGETRSAEGRRAHRPAARERRGRRPAMPSFFARSGSGFVVSVLRNRASQY